MKLKIVLRTMVCAIMWWGHCSYMQADEVNSISEESSVFYVDDFTASKQINTRSSSEHWQVSSVIKNCFDQGNIGQAAWLMTADGETQLSVTLEYLGDDDRYKIVSQEATFYFYEGSDLFHDDSKVLITDVATYVGSYTTEGTEKTATVNLTAPSSFPYTSVPYYTYYAVINVKFENGGTASVAKKIGISRVGVIILHGLNDNSESFMPMRDYLLGTGQFLDAQIYVGDYKGTNTSSFDYNTHTERVVEKGLKELSDKLFATGIASTKFDMVGHSMGGILFRLYNQEIDNKHTNKIITLNTPHFGSPLGNVAPGLFESVNSKARTSKFFAFIKDKIDANWNPNGGRKAISDLAIGSDAMSNLNSNRISMLSGIPVYSVGTHFYGSYRTRLAESIELIKLLYHLFRKDTSQNIWNSYLNNSDLVVAVKSQIGGLENFQSIYTGDYYAFHCNSPKWRTIQREIKRLLLAAPIGGNFCMTGFDVSAISPRTRTGFEEFDSVVYLTDFVEPSPLSFIKIEVQPVIDGELNYQMSIDHSDDLIATVAFATFSDGDMLSDYDSDQTYFSHVGTDEEVTFYAIGRTNYDALVIDSVKVNLTSETRIENISCHNEISYSVNNGQLELHNMPLEPYEITIYDMLGHVLMSGKNNSGHRYSLNSNSSMFIVELKVEDKVQTLKIYNSNEN